MMRVADLGRPVIGAASVLPQSSNRCHIPRTASGVSSKILAMVGVGMSFSRARLTAALHQFLVYAAVRMWYLFAGSMMEKCAPSLFA